MCECYSLYICLLYGYLVKPTWFIVFTHHGCIKRCILPHPEDHSYSFMIAHLLTYITAFECIYIIYTADFVFNLKIFYCSRYCFLWVSFLYVLVRNCTSGLVHAPGLCWKKFFSFAMRFCIFHILYFFEWLSCEFS